MANVDAVLEELMSLHGAIGVAVADYSSGMTLVSVSSGTYDVAFAAAHESEAIRSELKTLKSLKMESKVEDILVTMTDQYNILRVLSREKNLFFFLTMKRADANLALARRKLVEAEAKISV